MSILLQGAFGALLKQLQDEEIHVSPSSQDLVQTAFPLNTIKSDCALQHYISVPKDG